MVVESKRGVTLDGKPMTLVGPALKVGDRAPNFTLIAADMSEIKLESLKGKPALLSTLLSVSTSICDAATKRFNEAAGALSNKVPFLTVSTDLPYSLKSWCTAAGVEHVNTTSDHKDTNFGQAFGTLVKELRAHSRAIFVLDKDGVINYVEYVPEIGNHPDYDKALAAIKALAQ